MMNFFLHPIVVSLMVGGVVFYVVYTQFERGLALLRIRTTESESEINNRLDAMLIDINPKRLHRILTTATYSLATIAFLAVWPNVAGGFLLFVLVVTLSFVLPKIIVNNLWEKRSDRIVQEMVDGMTMMTNSIRAGQSVTQAMERVVENLKGPLSQEFNVVLNKVRLGMSVEDALVEFADKIQRPDAQMMVTSIVVLKETGGNLAETFATIASTIRERQKVEKKIEALTAQGQMQAIIISAVPFALLGLFLVMDPAYIIPMFTTPLGWVFLVLMLSLQTIGLVVMKRIITIKV